MSTQRSKYSLLERINFEDLYNTFSGLEERQQYLVGAGLILVFLLLLFLPLSCISSKLSSLEDNYSKVKSGQEDFMKKIATYQSTKATLVAIQKQYGSANSGGSLSTIIESLATEAGIGTNIDRLKPVQLGTSDYYDEEGVDAVLSKVSLDQIVSLLHKIENHPSLPMKIKKIQIKPKYRKRDELSVTFQVSTIKLKEGEESE